MTARLMPDLPHAPLQARLLRLSYPAPAPRPRRRRN